MSRTTPTESYPRRRHSRGRSTVCNRSHSRGRSTACNRSHSRGRSTVCNRSHSHVRSTFVRHFPVLALAWLLPTLAALGGCASHSHGPEEAEVTFRLDVDQYGAFEAGDRTLRITDARLGWAHLDFVVAGPAGMAMREGAPLGSRLAAALEGVVFRPAHAHPGHDHGPVGGEVIEIDREGVLHAQAEEALRLPLVVARYDGLNLGWRPLSETDVPDSAHAGFALVLQVEEGEERWEVGVRMDPEDHSDGIPFGATLQPAGCALVLHLRAAPEGAAALLDGWTPPAAGEGVAEAPEAVRGRLMDPAYWSVSTGCEGG